MVCRKKSYALVAITSMTILFVACDGGGDTAEEMSPATTDTTAPSTSTTEAPATTTSTTSTSTTTTTIDPVEDDKAAYFVAVSTLNPAVGALYDRYSNSSGGIPWSDVPALCAELIPLQERFVADLQEHEWRADVQDEIDAVIDANVIVLGHQYACRDLPGTADAQAVNDAALADAETRLQEAVSLARAALGLPLDR